ncbi:MAG TPA: PQQ-binding-like beta-propeller repeat protein [Allosphingosinicella sp.]|uniref:outer membrane protein assembly factor BamB family protein n=1 Tax=Allosphingosinicella sp. TaxID=2823234 RepID=UPI002ED9798F
MKRILFAVTAMTLVSGCGLLNRGEKPTTPTVGQRIAVLTGEASVEVDPALADVAVTLPGITANADWAQPGGNATKSMGHLALGTTLAEAWSVDAGEGSHPRSRLASAPVVGGGRVYAVDTLARLRAFDVRTGARVWEAGVGREEDLRGGRSWWNGEFTGNRGLLFGGGVSYDNGRVYATNGLGDVVAFDAATGNQLWRVRPSGPLRGAPTIALDTVYVVTQDNQLHALNTADGTLRWTGTGTLELANVLGAAAPAVAQGTVVAGFSSGELSAYRYENGRVVWQDALARTSISTAVASLSDIDAEPVIDQGRVYAIGQGGRMVALELVTGQRIWEINAAGISTPWVAGDWIFVLTDQSQLLAVARTTGRIRWMSQLPRWRDEEDKKGPISWVGPVLAGGRLIVASSQGHIVNVSPTDGAVQSTIQNRKRSFLLPPVVAENTFFLMSDDGRLTAWR